jgi:hypothetical protein
MNENEQIDVDGLDDTIPQIQDENIQVETKTRKATVIQKPFPSFNLEDSLSVIRSIKDFNAGNPWTGKDIANALNRGSDKSNEFFYLTQAARDYGLSVGTSRAKIIEISELGRKYLYAESEAGEREALTTAFLTVSLFKDVYEYYKGGNLPEMKYLQNMLESRFKLPPSLHQEFYQIYQANCRFLDSIAPSQVTYTSNKGESPHLPTIVRPSEPTDLIRAFVIMPLSERTQVYPSGFYNEVLNNLIIPAAQAAGFEAYTARKDGSDIIHSTIITELLRAELVIADLTEHNPNVLFELGFRMAEDKPVALIRARGTAPVFDVDNLLRVWDYNSNLWKSTLENDVPALTKYLKGTWQERQSKLTYKRILTGQAN